jgi:hypothetical protein
MGPPRLITPVCVRQQRPRAGVEMSIHCSYPLELDPIWCSLRIQGSKGHRFALLSVFEPDRRPEPPCMRLDHHLPSCAHLGRYTLWHLGQIEMNQEPTIIQDRDTSVLRIRTEHARDINGQRVRSGRRITPRIGERWHPGRQPSEITCVVMRFQLVQGHDRARRLDVHRPPQHTAAGVEFCRGSRPAVRGPELGQDIDDGLTSPASLCADGTPWMKGDIAKDAED